MDNLKGAFCYLAGHIETSENAISWREMATLELEKIGLRALNPLIQCFENQLNESEEQVKYLKGLLSERKFSEVHDYAKHIIRRDLRMCDRADCLIVNLEADRGTYGTTHEIVLASVQRKPILVRMDDLSKIPIWYAGLIDFDLAFEKWEDLFNYLKEINSSSLDKIDSKYWKIWKQQYV